MIYHYSVINGLNHMYIETVELLADGEIITDCFGVKWRVEYRLVDDSQKPERICENGVL